MTLRLDMTSQPRRPLDWVYDDGGRGGAGFKGKTGDCGVRALTIALDEDYQAMYETMFHLQREYGETRRDRAAKAIQRRGASPRLGLFRQVLGPYLVETCGWRWTPLKFVGDPRTHHAVHGELPPRGPMVCSMRGHYAAVVDGKLRDTWDSGKHGSAQVSGIWTPGQDDLNRQWFEDLAAVTAGS